MRKALLLILVVLIAFMTGCAEPEHVHEWGGWEVYKAATCTEDGISVRKCRTCGELDKTTKAVSAPGHTWDDGKVTASTCSADGVKTYTCTVCNTTRAEALPGAPGNHSYAWVTKDEATFLIPKTEKEICSLCNAESGNTRKTEEYKTIEGYWSTNEEKLKGTINLDDFEIEIDMGYQQYGFSFDDASSFIVDIFFATTNKEWSGTCASGSYSWETDKDGKRTILTMGITTFEPSESVDSDGKSVLTLEPTDSTAVLYSTMVLTRRSTTEHIHSGNVKLIENDDSYHRRYTDCGDLHPAVAGLKESHTYDNTDPDKAEHCSVCNKTRKYKIELYSSSDTSKLTYTENVTKAEGFKLGETYTPLNGTGTSIEVESWKFMDGSDIPVDDDDIYHPESDVKIVYTRKTSAT